MMGECDGGEELAVTDRDRKPYEQPTLQRAGQPDRLAEIKAQLARLETEPNNITRTGMLIDLGRDAVPWLIGEVERLRARLRELEWEGGLDGAGVCPVCHEYDSHGHAPDCWLAAALGRTSVPERREGPAPG